MWTKQNRSHGALVQLGDSQRVTESSCGRQQVFKRREHLVAEPLNDYQSFTASGRAAISGLPDGSLFVLSGTRGGVVSDAADVTAFTGSVRALIRVIVLKHERVGSVVPDESAAVFIVVLLI